MTPNLVPKCRARRAFPAIAAVAFIAVAFAPATQAQPHSVARQWNELLLESIRNDFARPTVHARNLYHVSVAMWDAWAVYDFFAKPILTTEKHPTFSPLLKNFRNEAISHACYRILYSRFSSSPGAAVMLPMYDQLMATLGYDKNFTSTVGDSPAAVGNRIAVNVLAYGLADHSNEPGGYANQHYFPINDPLVPALPGNPTITDPNRWQPLALDFFIDQSGHVIPGAYPEFLSPEWGQVSAFALALTDVHIYQRSGFDYWVYHDPGSPPLVGTATSDDYKWGFELVAIWSGHLDQNDGVMIDVSPGSIGGAPLPAGPSEYDQFYDILNGGDSGQGYALNPVTGQPYAPQIVPRGDYARILAEFWADGPSSETPPGHWFTILNYVSDHPSFQKQLAGQGPVLDALEWDVKSYLALGGAMHDCAIAAWGVKGWYDFVRPVSAIRYLADRGQSSDSSLPSYHPDGIRLYPGYIELVTAATTAPGQKHEHLVGSEGKIAMFTWRGPDYIPNPATDQAGCGWILAENWWPYQRPTFVTPPFAGYVSGHSTYSRAAAVTLHRLTGSPYFPDGLAEFFCPQDQYLVFEEGPSVDVTLQWASYYDASDQCSLSRIWGGIHPPADDIPGRKMGQVIGEDAFARAVEYFTGTACGAMDAISLYGNGCAGAGGYVPSLTMDGCPSPGQTIHTYIANGAPQTLALVLVGVFEVDFPAAGSCSLLITPTILTVPLMLNGTPGVPGSGSLALSSVLAPPIQSGTTLKAQAFIADATNSWGYSSTNALSVTLK